MIITEELLERYLRDETSTLESLEVELAAKQDIELEKTLIEARCFKAIRKARKRESLPVERMAAKSKDNQCVFDCERHIIELKNPDYSNNRTLFTDVKEEMAFMNGERDTRWLTRKGTHITHIGNILKQNGLVPTRHSLCEMDDLVKALERKDGIIAVVNQDILLGKKGDNKPDHAVCVSAIYDNTISLFNPATNHKKDDEYPIDRFLRAWETSDRFTVFANTPKEKFYDPHPSILFNRIELDEDLDDVIEAVAEYNHDVWAEERINEGYVYGTENNSDKTKGPLTNKDLLPYSELPEKEKDYDRQMSIGTIKLLDYLGYSFEKISENDFRCPHCNERIKLEWSYCSHCGEHLTTEDFIRKRED